MSDKRLMRSTCNQMHRNCHWPWLLVVFIQTSNKRPIAAPFPKEDKLEGSLYGELDWACRRQWTWTLAWRILICLDLGDDEGSEEGIAMGMMLDKPLGLLFGLVDWELDGLLESSVNVELDWGLKPEKISNESVICRVCVTQVAVFECLSIRVLNSYVIWKQKVQRMMRRKIRIKTLGETVQQLLGLADGKLNGFLKRALNKFFDGKSKHKTLIWRVIVGIGVQLKKQWLIVLCFVIL